MHEVFEGPVESGNMRVRGEFNKNDLLLAVRRACLKNKDMEALKLILKAQTRWIVDRFRRGRPIHIHVDNGNLGGFKATSRYAFDSMLEKDYSNLLDRRLLSVDVWLGTANRNLLKTRHRAYSGNQTSDDQSFAKDYLCSICKTHHRCENPACECKPRAKGRRVKTP